MPKVARIGAIVNDLKGGGKPEREGVEDALPVLRFGV